MQNFRVMKLLKQAYTSSALLLLLLTSYSCSDFLEQEPGSKTSITEQLSNKAGALEALAGVYRDLEANVRSATFSMYGDYLGGNITFTPRANGSNVGVIITPFIIENVYSFQDQAMESDMESFYDGSYDIINQCNLILEFINEIPDASEEEKNQISAEALTIRAYSHFLLSTVYSQNYGFTTDASHLGIVYNTSTLTSGSIPYPSRETVAENYSLIENDLNEALNLYTNNSALNEGPSYSYFNEYSTKALMARFYLYKTDWDNAFAMADDVIKNSGISLTPLPAYVAQWEEPNAPLTETLLEFSIPRDDEGNGSAGMSLYFGYNYDSNSGTLLYNQYVGSTDLVDLFEPQDNRLELFEQFNIPTFVRVEEDQNIYEDLPYYFTNKFQDNAGYIASRLSEMYLIRAEASFRNNLLNDAQNDINIIRARANASLLTDTSNLEDAILLERRKELCFEGHLFFDLVRNKKNIRRDAGCLASICDLDYPSPKFVAPIPQSNLNLNSNLEQNESY